VVVGLLRPSTFFGGRLLLSTDAALQALEPLAQHLGMDKIAAAEGVIRMANETIAQAMRLVSIERGYDPRDYTIVAFGGAGPLHAAALAAELGVSQVLVPFNPGLLSAYGLMLAGTRQDFLRTQILDIATLDPDAVRQVFGVLHVQAQKEFEAYGIDWKGVHLRRSFDMRYKGQAYELVIDVDDILSQRIDPKTLLGRFEEAHRQRYGHAPGGENVEVVNFRLSASCPSRLRDIESGKGFEGGQVKKEEGTAHVDGAETPCHYFQRPSLPDGYVVKGPAVIEEPTATTFVPVDWQAKVDDRLNMLLTLGGA
jgi:N-methylhydantoinase A